MAVVGIKKVGEATLIFHDDSCKDKTAEEIEKVIKSVTEIAWRHVRASVRKEKESKEIG